MMENLTKASHQILTVAGENKDNVDCYGWLFQTILFEQQEFLLFTWRRKKLTTFLCLQTFIQPSSASLTEMEKA